MSRLIALTVLHLITAIAHGQTCGMVGAGFAPGPSCGVQQTFAIQQAPIFQQSYAQSYAVQSAPVMQSFATTAYAPAIIQRQVLAAPAYGVGYGVSRVGVGFAPVGIGYATGGFVNRGFAPGFGIGFGINRGFVPGFGIGFNRGFGIGFGGFNRGFGVGFGFRRF